MDKRALIVLAFIFGGLFLVFFAFLVLALAAVRTDDGLVARGPGVGVVEVEDVIMDSKRYVEQLERFREDQAIQGVLVRVNSPGGAVGPSQEIHEAVERTAEVKPVVVSMGNMAASGGYYLAVAADEIVANPGTITGSIGAVVQVTNLEGLAEWARVDVETIRSGDLKDAGNPFRSMTEAERSYWLELVMQIHDQFVEAVAEGRGRERGEIDPVADGRVLTGQQALESGLVDRLGGFETAVDRVAELADIPERPQLVYPRRDELQILRDLFGGTARAVVSEVRDEIVSPRSYGQPASVWLLSSDAGVGTGH